ncbi:MAG: capsule biosynthesis protein CapK [Candidatus Eisenbacteria bacterium]|nr:capsule biosynthesis protein CapK [Candidatus Eisenbacteria bacterium]MCC7143035.1 capsule biosynthesis protein CapK [Candidatus Eisenbacteria bacterium]
MSTKERPDQITDQDRYPTLSEHGQALLRFLREHPNAPIFRNQSGNRLEATDLEQVRAFEAEVLRSEVGWPRNGHPAWLEGHLERCLEWVPHYRRYGSKPPRFEDLPTTDRGDLGRDIAQFVPDDLPIDRLINFRTSGTTGHGLLLASHPTVAAGYLAFHKRALRRLGIELTHGRGKVGVVLVGWQRRCFTYVSVTPSMDESGLVKINLWPGDWRDPADRAKYLDALAPEVYTGDPISFAELLDLPLTTRPRVLLSTSMQLLPGLRRRLEAHFRCPVLDLYSMNEAGPVAVHDDVLGGHRLLQPRLYVEILGAGGERVADGERGEITLSGGFNPWLPLLRYRTGDFAALSAVGDAPVLIGLEGRPPVRFRAAHGEWFNNIEITHALQGFAISRHTVHQRADGSVMARVQGVALDPAEVEHALRGLFGAGASLQLELVREFGDKVIQYTSALDGGMA